MIDIRSVIEITTKHFPITLLTGPRQMVYDEIKFINFFKLLTSNTEQELIYNDYAKQVGVAINTVKAWISALTKTGIIYLVEPYNETSITKRIVKRPKLYFFDTRLAAYTLKKSFLKERFFETFTMNEGITQPMYYYRDNDQNEIDLALIKDETMTLIEFKTGQSFYLSDVKAFKKLENTKLLKGKNAIICSYLF